MLKLNIFRKGTEESLVISHLSWVHADLGEVNQVFNQS
jgi:hypothetical protein